MYAYHTLKILTYKPNDSKKIDFVKLNKKTALILNDIDKDEIEEYIEKFVDSAEEISEKIEDAISEY